MGNETSEQLDVLDTIMSVVSKATLIPKAFIQSKWRKREVVIARQMYHYYANKYTKCSLMSISESTFSPSHASVIYSRKEVVKILEKKELPYYLWTKRIESSLFNKLHTINKPKIRIIDMISLMEDESDSIKFYAQVIEKLSELPTHGRADVMGFGSQHSL